MGVLPYTVLSMPRRAAIALIGLLGAACAPGQPDTVAPSTTVIAGSSTSVPPTTAAMAPAATTTVEPASTTTASADRYEIVDGEFKGPGSFALTVGDTFRIEVVSDRGGELHVHGFDLLFELAAGEVTLIEVVATAPGIYEVELEGSHAHLFDIEVGG